MKTERRHPDAWTAVAVHRPEEVTHHHYVTHAKWSPESHEASQSAKRGWPVFRNEHRPSLASVSTDQQPLMRSETTTDSRSPISESYIPFAEKYGRCLEILHYGTNSTVRLHQIKPSIPSSKSKQLVAIKVYRYNILSTSNPLTQASSHCSITSISGLHPDHPNILPITDLLYNDRSELCLVMPFCAGGDLHELISRSGDPIPTHEADCIMTQILRALAFLHEHEVAHRDIRLETILLTEHGAVKLAGFGDGHIRRLWTECASPTEQEDSGEVASSTASFPGMSLPYIPPEGFQARSHVALRREDQSHEHDDHDDHDPRPADVWATAIIYLTMIMGRLIWRSARPHREDPRYLEYLHCRRSEDGYPPIEALGMRRRNAIYAMLHPLSRKRITTKQMLQSEWISRVSIRRGLNDVLELLI
ncbi:hypothetical protein N7493_005019 [Penicillium malachiteum]|uniref:Protein kinase domain-containing protein n=1 Tax=Penicillium malachiteum TaxID=1324776 RepID=A0AAD6MW82_9EURO|nr:hypothetical protein N7493_005019 [Penicillium malachiteum]